MHFTKTLVSLFAISGFAAARFEHSDSSLARREIAEVAHEDYLIARDEYIEKRDLFRRYGGNGRCSRDGNMMRCKRYGADAGRGGAHCGKCRRGASTGEYCLCKWDKKKEEPKKKDPKKKEDPKKQEEEEKKKAAEVKAQKEKKKTGKH